MEASISNEALQWIQLSNCFPIVGDFAKMILDILTESPQKANAQVRMGISLRDAKKYQIKVKETADDESSSCS